MAKYLIERRIIEEVELDPDELMTIGEAAEALGLAIQTVATHLDAGTLTSVIDPDAPARQGRRLVLRDEVARYAAARRPAGP